ncbi:MAG TPA: Uma2 family endonuclease [Polyangiaceae bacterium]|nr:Uma2 family endonuclease [Polyangiaceae bacterium]
MVQRALDSNLSERPRYLEPHVPVLFPESADVPETQLHFELRTILYQLLSDHLGPAITVGSDQFVYFDADNPRQCLAPDVYVRLAPRAAPIRSWKTWERGSPEIAVEIISDDDRSREVWSTKLQRYRQLGVAELVRFDPEAASGGQLRIWNRVDGALVEREVQGSHAPSLILDMDWLVAPADGFELALRIATGEEPRQPALTRSEARKAEADARRAEAEARRTEADARRAEAEARRIAEARVRELEAELAKRSPPRTRR